MESLPSDINKERKKLFFIELVRVGIPFDDAYAVSAIVASYKPTEALTQQEIWLVNDVCRRWLDERNREMSLHQHLEELGMSHGSLSEPDDLANTTRFSDEIDSLIPQITPSKPNSETLKNKTEIASAKRPTVMAIARKLATLSHSSDKVRDVLILNSLNSYKQQYLPYEAQSFN
ncbi:MAG: hypothetical protein SFY66_08265 [Oculatellaceae cyanobacterium bins.114]|nr:hypothetical protein [Oculatellaceae cyanobacterium bins.114]